MFVRGEKRNRRTEKNKYTIECILILSISIFFVGRCIGVINNYRERGGYAYVQLLNYSLPVVEHISYDKSDYAENNLTIKKVIIEALGLGNITTMGIVGNEISFFGYNTDAGTSNNNSNKSSTNPFSLFSPYEVKDESIAKVTPEEIAQLEAESAAYDGSLKKMLESTMPEVLIYHTHSHEAYSEIGEGNNWRTENEDLNIIGVGDILAKELEEGYGISVIHDKTLHDVDYNGCYLRSRDTVQNYLNQYGDFKLIIDLHRDSSANRDNVATTLNGESLAKFMFVIGQSSPKLEQNQALVNNLIDITNRLFPSLLRTEYNGGTFVYDTSYGTFNLGLSNNMLLVEDGGVGNTAQEAKLTAKYIARVIAEYINRQ